MAETGDLCGIRSEIKFEWKIKDFLLLSDNTDTYYRSPKFDFSGASWKICIFPNGQTKNASGGWIGLYIMRTSAGIPVSAYYSLSLKTGDGKSDLELKDTHVFEKEDSGKGFPNFIQRSVLIERKSELLPSGDLTVICTLKNSEKHDADGNEDSKKASVDASLQTNEGAGNEDCKKVDRNAYVDAFSQTNEGADGVSLCQDYKKVLLDGKNHDLILKVGDKELRAHQDILRARSRVFDSMLNHDMKEKNSGVIDVPDCDPQAMELFLSYVYCGIVETQDQNIMLGLYYIADKYEMEKLKEECCDFIKKSLSTTNICDVFRLALNHSDSSLLDYATEYFMNNTLDIMCTVEWQVFLKDNSTVGNELLIKSFKKLKT